MAKIVSTNGMLMTLSPAQVLHNANAENLL
jgi:hypothetical protein